MDRAKTTIPAAESVLVDIGLGGEEGTDQECGGQEPRSYMSGMFFVVVVFFKYVFMPQGDVSHLYPEIFYIIKQ